MKKILLSVAVLLLLCALSSCMMPRINITDNRKDYVSGNTSLDGETASKITKLTIDWISGNVSIKRGEDDTLSFSESSSKPITSETEMCYRLSENELSIAFSKNDLTNVTVKKELTVILPKDAVLDELALITISADASVDNIAVTGKLSVDSVSGGLNAETVGETRAFAVSTISGSISLVSDGISSVDIDTTSGNATVLSGKMIDNTKLDSISGDITLYLPEDASFTTDFSSISGAFSSDFPAVASNNKFTVGSGEAKIAFDSISGDLKISKIKETGAGVTK